MVVWSLCFNIAYKNGSKTILEIAQDEKSFSLRKGDSISWTICKKLPKFVTFLDALGISGTSVMPEDIADYNFRFSATTTNGHIHVLGGTDILQDETVCDVDLATMLGELLNSNSFAAYFYGYAVLINTDYVDYRPGNLSAEASNLIDSLNSFGRTVSTFTNISSSGFSEALAGTRMLFIPEQEEDYLALSEEASTVIRNWVNDGGTLLVFYDDGDEFINDTFDMSITALGEGGGVSATKTPDSIGSPVQDGPAEISWNNATSSIDVGSLPVGSKSYYQDGTQSVVADIPYGDGRILFIGWDWYNPTLNDGWLTVLDMLTE